MSFKPIYKLRDWIDPELLVNDVLSSNPSPTTINYIEKKYIIKLLFLLLQRYS
jgi:hypothetical protein